MELDSSLIQCTKATVFLPPLHSLTLTLFYPPPLSLASLGGRQHEQHWHSLGSCSNFTSGFFFYSSLPQQLLLRARAKLLLLQQLLLLYFYSRQGLKLLLFYFWLLPRARAKQPQLTTHADSPPSSSTPPHPIRIHTRSGNELRSFTDRLTGLDHEELSSPTVSPRMQSSCSCSSKAVNKWVSRGLQQHPLPALLHGSPPLLLFSQNKIEKPWWKLSFWSWTWQANGKKRGSRPSKRSRDTPAPRERNYSNSHGNSHDIEE